MKKALLFITSILATTLIPSCSCSKQNVKKNKAINVTLNKDTHLDGGDILVNGTHLHFDENSVNENPSDSFVEIGPYGSLYLQNYVPGITRVYVEAKHNPDYSGEFFLATSATPNAAEYFSLYSSTHSFVNMTPDRPYFSIHNRAGNNLLIDLVTIEGESNDYEAKLANKIVLNDIHVPYTGEAINPYERCPIDEKDIPSDRIVKKIGQESYVEPGRYTYGYEVYSKINGALGKMLYSKTANLYIEGSGETNTHLAIFHIKDGIVTVPVKNHQTVDVSSVANILSYNWNSPYNDFSTPFSSDRHYYPNYSVVGLPVNKDGDGCMPISRTYNAVEKSFSMPEPVMDPGYQFGGWFLDQELTTLFDEDGEYEGNLNLYANCIETERNFRRVYYHDYDGSLINRIDYLYDNEEITLPTFAELKTKSNSNKLMYRVMIGANSLGMLMPKGNYPEMEKEYPGDKLTYDLIKDSAGDIHLYVSTYDLYYDGPATFTRFFEDAEENAVISGLKMPETHQDEDIVLPARYIEVSKETWRYDYNLYKEPARSDEFLYTDEVDGYIMDQSSYNSISTYGYGNKFANHKKPLEGILRHESVLKVGRRAFFNRYGLKGTYFPRNSREFDIESYANTEFNDYLFLPKTLQIIDQRAFVGSQDIKYVALPKTIKSIGKDAFALGEYDEASFSFKNIKNRTLANELITFLYEGSQDEYNRLDIATREEIENNALKVVFNVNYNTRYAR